MKTRKEATKLGQKLLELMDGEGWNLQVWENFGWHYCVYNGAISISPSGINDNHYFALLGDRDTYSGGGLAVWTEHKTYSDPNKAVIRQLKIATQYVQKLTKTIEAVVNRINIQDKNAKDAELFC